MQKKIGDIWIGRRKGKSTNMNKKIIQPYFAPPKFLSPEVVKSIMSSE
jgi:hypothetical protein